jgi:Aspartyl/Asparaginyl beta-hydroxylase
MYIIINIYAFNCLTRGIMANTFRTILPITIDLEEAFDYYCVLERDYQHLKWKMPTTGFRRIEQEGYQPTIYGWAIQTTGDVNKPLCILYYPNLQGRDIAKETACVFGFAKKLLEVFPTAFRMYLTVNSPGVVVLPHVDDKHMPRKIYRIVIPIQTNDKATWTTDEGIMHFDAGTVNLIDPSLRHGTQNDGDTDRVHLMFEIFEEDLETVKKMSIHI